MMHVFRLLEMAIEIGKEKKIKCKRAQSGFLLEIKSGKLEYEELLKMADLKKEEMKLALKIQNSKMNKISNDKRFNI